MVEQIDYTQLLLLTEKSIKRTLMPTLLRMYTRMRVCILPRIPTPYAHTVLHRWIPDYIKGDLDSVTDDVLDYYMKRVRSKHLRVCETHPFTPSADTI